MTSLWPFPSFPKGDKHDLPLLCPVMTSHAAMGTDRPPVTLVCIQLMAIPRALS